MSKQSGFEKLARETSLYPQEQLARVAEKPNVLFIGLPKEVSLQENRISLTPDAVDVIVANGHKVWIETGAGVKANFSDQEYSEAGAEIVQSREELYQANIILKVEPPTIEEIDFFKPNQIIFSALQMATRNEEYFRKLSVKKVIAIAYEMVEDKVGGRPIVRAMSEIAGNTVMQIAAEYLTTTNNGLGVILGGITGVPPTKVVILGAGTVAEYAARAASSLGAEIMIFDNHIYKLRRIKHALSFQVFTSTLDSSHLSAVLKDADVVIGALRPDRGSNKIVITEEMVQSMKEGAVIIDLSIDHGGCVETSELTTHELPVIEKYGVIHYGVPNITSRVARTASYVLSNIFTPTLLRSAEEGSLEDMIYNHTWFLNGVYVYKGGITKKYIANKFNLPFKDLSLVMAARM
ncbi:Alanine dehydrogenase [hydrothermal vent metagenome]|uniref:alanine dehydrogenase n=1 Tax=hydrothermal vent metagenome TaxID=652676 RepID=A0A3B0V6V6_9ZZZZ